MPFGVTGGPGTFQSAMNATLAPILRKCVLVFLDDILVYSATLEDHLSHLEAVLQLLDQDGWKVKPSKCSFAQRSIAYLGHVISEHGVAVDKQKVDAILSWPVPSSARAVRGFLGLAGYYRRFIRDYGSIAAPLTALLKKEGFRWNQDAERAFRALQRALTKATVLQLPDFDRDFVVECDASGSGFGAILHQGDGPLAFFSRPIAPRHA